MVNTLTIEFNLNPVKLYQFFVSVEAEKYPKGTAKAVGYRKLSEVIGNDRQLCKNGVDH